MVKSNASQSFNHANSRHAISVIAELLEAGYTWAIPKKDKPAHVRKKTSERLDAAMARLKASGLELPENVERSFTGDAHEIALVRPDVKGKPQKVFVPFEDLCGTQIDQISINAGVDLQ